MVSVRVCFLGVVLVAGCEKPSNDGCHKDTDCKADRVCVAHECVAPPAAPTVEPRASCAAALTNAYRVAAEAMRKAQIDGNAAAVMQRVTVAHCEADRWSAAIVGCLSTITTYDAMLTCTDRLNADQKTRWTNDLAAIPPSRTRSP